MRIKLVYHFVDQMIDPSLKGELAKQNPDNLFLQQPEFYSNCSNDLKYIVAEFLNRRQIIDIPVINPEYTEHQIFKKVCLNGFCNVSKFPTQVNANISYGENIQVTIAYLHNRLYLPFARMGEF